MPRLKGGKVGIVDIEGRELVCPQAMYLCDIVLVSLVDATRRRSTRERWLFFKAAPELV